jgi:formyl-CoA transferase
MPVRAGERVGPRRRDRLCGRRPGHHPELSTTCPVAFAFHYRSRDGLFVVVAANQDTLFTRLAGLIGRPELAGDPRFSDHAARGENQDELDEILAGWAARHTAEEIISSCHGAGVVAGPVNTAAEVVEDEQFQARGMFVEHIDDQDGASVTGVNVVPRLSDTPGGVRWAGPRMPGSHNKVYGDLLGLSGEQLADLESGGVL